MIFLLRLLDLLLFPKSQANVYNMNLKQKILSNPKLKQKAYNLLMPKYDYRPRWWFRTLIIPFLVRRGKKSTIRASVRLDLLPNHECRIGGKSIIETNSLINNTVGYVKIGEGSIIGINNIIIGPVSIGNNVLLAQHIVLSGLNHNYLDISIPPVKQGVTTKEIIIEDNVWIGANSTITAGVTIGKHSIIGAGSVVTKSIPSYSVAVGSPAKVKKRYNFDNQKWEDV